MIYVSSDWHGCPPEKIKSLLDKVKFDENNDFLFVLGDVIDRGEHSVELLKFLMSHPASELLLGNHESFLLRCAWIFDEITDEAIDDLDVSKLATLNTWKSQANGGEATIEALRRETPNTRADILEFLGECPLYDSVNVNGRDFLLVHGGLGNYREGKKMDEYTHREIVWYRPTLETRYSEKFTTVTGHTPTYLFGDEHRGKIIKTDTWIDIDTGAASGLDPCILRLDDMQEFYL